MTDVLAGWIGALADRYRIDVAPDGLPRLLGQGGMASVYLALDLKHQRRVAVKVLRPELAAVVGAERFLQEIRVTATLQHPHILGLIDSGIVEGERGTLPYYVMPYVEGKSLREKLKREIQLPLDDALAITTAVASALDYAHRHGVIHRDIKPENILLHEGQALVADFGIALALSAAGGTRLTETGLALGTPQYMSPEQGLAEREIGPRSDIYSLGCVLYEMLAGEPPFTGPTAQVIAAKVAREAPRPLRLARPHVPAEVEAAVTRALEKLPADRFASAGELVEAWEGHGRAVEAVVTLPAPNAARTYRLTAALGTIAVLAIGAAVWGWLRPSHTIAEQGVKRFEIPLPPDVPARETPGSRIALAPDGKTLVYLGITDGVRRLFLRSLDQTTARLLAGTEGASVPFYSPDSKWVGFVAGAEIKKISLGGGDPVNITKTSGMVGGASWGESGVIVFSSFTDRELWQVAAVGGTPQVLLRPDSARGEVWVDHPEFLPGGEMVLFSSISKGSNAATIEAVHLRNGRSVPLVAGSIPHYGGSDRLIYMGEEGLEAIRLNLPSLRVVMSIVPLHVLPNETLQSKAYAVSHEGTLIYLPNQATETTTLVLVDRQGTLRPLAGPGRFAQPRFSPDGRRVAVAVEKGNESDIWVYGVAPPSVRRLTFDTHASSPAWTPDGKRVSWMYFSGDSTQVFWAGADGAASARPVRPSDHRRFEESSWTPDGRWLLASDGGLAPTDLWEIPTDPALKPRRLLRTPFIETQPVVSPDGRWLAYTSNESGQWEVFVQEFPGPGGRFQVSLAGGLMPVWDRSGKELYYRSGNRLYSASITGDATFNITDRRVLFELPQLRSGHLEHDYDVSPDGQHFVMLQRAEPLEKLVVVLNWPDELVGIKPK